VKDEKDHNEGKSTPNKHLRDRGKKNSPTGRRFGCIRSIVFFGVASMQKSVLRIENKEIFQKM
jgi:hypothetical protein